jgi:signal transduction histidine kinase
VTPSRLSSSWHTRLEARLLLFVTLVTATSVGAMLVASQHAITERATEYSHQVQDAAKAAFDRLIDRRGAFATSQTRLITELPVFRAHLSDERLAADAATMQVLAEQYRASVEADFLLVANAKGRWMGRANWPAGPDPDWPLLTSTPRPAERQGLRTIVALSDGIYLVVVEPARFLDEPLGWLAVGYRLDDGFASELALITNADVNLIARDRLWASSLEPEHRDRLRRSVATGALQNQDWLQLGDSRYSSREYPLPASGGTASLLLLRDWRRTQGLIDGLQRQLLWIGLAAFSMALIGSTIFSRRAARPLRDIVEAAREITRGDWTRRVPVRGIAEAATMAAAFNEMTSTLTALNSDLARAKAKVEQASRAKDQFLANVNHEMRTPLNGIMGMTSLALDTPLTGEQRDYLETVNSSAEALLAIVNDVLDFAKIDAGAIALDPRPFNLRECVTRSVKIVSAQAEPKRLSLTAVVGEQVPASLIGDEGRFRQVLLNLLSNAIKFTAAGSVSLRLDVEDRNDGRVTLHVVVADTGVGIPKEKQQLIFDPFVQADGSTTREYGGTGLGLTISARLIAMMGGRIWVESEPGHGSRFHFTAQLGVAAAAPRSLPALRTPA